MIESKSLILVLLMVMPIILGINFVGQEIIMKNYSMSFYFLCYGIALIIVACACHVLTSEKIFMPDFAHDKKSWIIFMCITFSITAWIFWLLGARHFSSVMSAMIEIGAVFFAIFFSWLLGRKGMDVPTVIGGVMIIAGVCIVTFSKMLIPKTV